MILTGQEIQERIAKGDICVYPRPGRIGTNSMDTRLGLTLLRYLSFPVDPKLENPVEEIQIPEDGMVLWPGDFVLGSTNERVDSIARDIVPMLEGRSSLARLGLAIHITAGFGDVGFCGNWTVELSAAVPIRIYPLMPIGQFYWIRCNPCDQAYMGKYQGSIRPLESRLHQEFGPKDV